MASKRGVVLDNDSRGRTSIIRTRLSSGTSRERVLGPGGLDVECMLPCVRGDLGYRWRSRAWD